MSRTLLRIDRNTKTRNMLSKLKFANFRSFKSLTERFPAIVNSPRFPADVPTASVASSPQPPHDVSTNSVNTKGALQRLASDYGLLHKGIKEFSTSPSIQINEEDDEISKVLADQINTQLTNADVGRMFAIVYISGKQRKVTTEDIVVLDKHIDAEIGDRIRINKVLLVGSKDFTLIGRPVLNLDLVRIEATVIEKTLSYTRVRFRYLRRQNNRKMRLRKERLTFLRINNIEVSSLEEQSTDGRVTT